MTTSTILQPRRILVAGDWHGDIAWSEAVVRMLPRLLPDESPRIVLHAGDFGIWPGRAGEKFLFRLDRALAEVDAVCWFVDGNHEDIPQLHKLAGDPDTTEPVAVRERITWLPRGHRWTWHGRTWLALGGARSVDRKIRIDRQYRWWPEEAITDAQAARAIAGGPADVMLCHDAPSSVPLRLPPPDPGWTSADLALSDRHRERLQEVVDHVRPSHLLHGHYHLHHETTVEMAHGPVRVTGLNRNDSLFGNYEVIDVSTMEYPKAVALA